jgi:hypothetical protein
MSTSAPLSMHFYYKELILGRGQMEFIHAQSAAGSTWTPKLGYRFKGESTPSFTLRIGFDGIKLVVK